MLSEELQTADASTLELSCQFTSAIFSLNISINQVVSDTTHRIGLIVYLLAKSSFSIGKYGHVCMLECVPLCEVQLYKRPKQTQRVMDFLVHVWIWGENNRIVVSYHDFDISYTLKLQNYSVTVILSNSPLIQKYT